MGDSSRRTGAACTARAARLQSHPSREALRHARNRRLESAHSAPRKTQPERLAVEHVPSLRFYRFPADLRGLTSPIEGYLCPPQSFGGLANAELHLWHWSFAGTRGLVDVLREHLSQDELDRRARFKFARLRERFVLARGMLREILSRCLRCAPNQVVFEYGAHGKPRLAPSCPTPHLEFNLAHDDQTAVCAVVQGRRVGVDVECESRPPLSDWRQIASSAFKPSEVRRLGALDPDAGHRYFLTLWTLKEAYCKAVGTGLAALSTCPAFGPLEVCAPSLCGQVRGPLGPWSYLSFTLSDGARIAVVVEAPDEHGREKPNPALLPAR